MAQEKTVVDGQSLWMDDHTRAFMHHGELTRYIEEYLVTGLSVNSRVLSTTMVNSTAYDQPIARRLTEGIYGESLALNLVHDDIRQAADMLRSIHDRTDGVDGWAMLPASPLAVDNSETLTKVILELRRKVDRPNILLRLPMLPERISNLEDLVYQGVPINVTNIYSRSQYQKVAQACLNGINRRIRKKLKPTVPIFTYIGICRLQAALMDKMSDHEAAEGAVAMAEKIYKSMRITHNSPEWERAYNFGARPLRMVWNCSCGAISKERKLSLAHRLRAPFTIVALPGELIPSFAQSRDKGCDMQGNMDCDKVIEKYQEQGIDVESVAVQLQRKAVELLRNQWVMMLEAVAKKSAEISHMKIDVK